jgi:endonuclease/exonuclease/phosphatase family metal-dependent hydrolase
VTARVFFLWLAFSFCFVAAACRIVLPDDEQLVIVSYNLENLFDAEQNGSEYSEFLPSAGWDVEDVQERLQRAAQAVSSCRPGVDILVLTEIENAALLDSFLEDFVVDRPMPYRGFAAAPEGATGVAIASRFPIVKLRSLQPRSGDYPPLRPLLEARIAVRDCELVVFANHWKSRRGGVAATEGLRRASAAILRQRLEELATREPDLAVVVAGDLNAEVVGSTVPVGSFPPVLVDAAAVTEWDRDAEIAPTWYTEEYRRSAGHLVVGSLELGAWEGLRNTAGLWDPWAGVDGGGSYWYENRWERIDVILVNSAIVRGGGVSLQAFGPVVNSDTADPDGVPRSWRTGGVSDHVPVQAVFSLPGY